VEVGADIWCMGWSFLGLSLGELEEGPGPPQPVFESFCRVFEAVCQGNALWMCSSTV
jgi:hypothetical protein